MEKSKYVEIEICSFGKWKLSFKQKNFILDKNNSCEQAIAPEGKLRLGIYWQVIPEWMTKGFFMNCGYGYK
jgi:hypothetical protein